MVASKRNVRNTKFIVKDPNLPPIPMASQISIFIITFLSFSSLHLTRKSFSMVKASLIELQWFESTVFTSQSQMCGLIDTAFMLAYAIGLFFAGAVADSINLRVFIFVGMVLSAFSSLGFGAAGFLDDHSITTYCFLWGLNGLIQSSGYPGNLAVMGNWYGERGRGTVIGMWSASGLVGNILGAAVCSCILSSIDSKIESWKLCMIISSTVLLAFSFPVLLFLVPHPSDAGLADPNAKSNLLDRTINENSRLLSKEKKISINYMSRVHFPMSLASSTTSVVSMEEGRDPIRQPRPAVASEQTKDSIFKNIVTATLTPGVVEYSLANACLKGVNYSLLFWLPFYLASTVPGFSVATAGYYSMLYDIGGIIGGFATGLLADLLGYKAPLVVLMILLATLTVWQLQFVSASSDFAIVGTLVATGVAMGGPCVLLGGCITTDLGHTCKKSLLATVTGIIDGTGSIGAAVMQYAIGYMTRTVATDASYSWSAVFTLLMMGNIVSALFLTRAVLKEFGVIV